MDYITTVIYFAKLVKELGRATQMHKQDEAVEKKHSKSLFLKVFFPSTLYLRLYL